MLTETKVQAIKPLRHARKVSDSGIEESCTVQSQSSKTGFPRAYT
jgi:hypothetical protein